MPKAGASGSPGDERSQFLRAIPRDGAAVRFTVDGHPAMAREGDSVLAALLTNGHVVRHLEFGGAPRAGFCLMGACQDCWVWLDGSDRARACTTPVAAGMRIVTKPPVSLVTDDA